MPRVSQETIEKLNDFIESLEVESIKKCALCNDTLVHFVKQAEARTGAGTLTVCRALANKINDSNDESLRGRVKCSARDSGECNIYMAQILSIYPDYVKIGKTSGCVKSRVASLSGIFLDNFELVAAYSFPAKYNPKNIERYVFYQIEKYRIVKNKEFFHKDCVDVFYSTMDDMKSQYNAERIY